MTLAGRQRLPFVGDHAERHVLAVLVPVVAHQLQHLEQLPEVQVLLIRDHVERLVEVIGVLAVLRRGEVARDVQRRAVGAQDQRRRHPIGLEVDDLRALILLEQPLRLQLVDDRLHLVVVEALAGVGIERHAQHVVDALGVLERDRLEPVEDLQRLGIAVLDALEPRAPLVVEGGIGLGLLVEAHVELDHLVHAAARDGVVVAPALVGGDHLAELRAPVAQMVDAHGVPAEEFIELVQRAADRRGRQMTDVKALGDVDRGIVDHDRLARAGTVAAVLFALRFGGAQRLFGEGRAVDEEVEVSLDRLDLAQKVRRDRAGERVRDHRRRLAQRLGQLETGKSEVAHRRIRRNLQRRGDVRRRQAGIAERAVERLENPLADGELEIHVHPTPVLNA